MARTIQVMGILAEHRGDHALALQHYREAEQRYLDLSSWEDVASTHQGIGNALSVAGQHEQALAATTSAIETLEQHDIDEPKVWARAKNDLSLRYYYLNDYTRAVAIQQELLADVLNDPEADLGTGHALRMNNLAGMMLSTPQWRDARALSEHAIAVQESAYSEASGYLNAGYLVMAALTLELGEKAQTARYANKVLRNWGLDTSRGRRAHALLASAQLHSGDVQQAYETLKPVLEFLDANNNVDRAMTSARVTEAEWALIQGHYQRGLKTLVPVMEKQQRNQSWRAQYVRLLHRLLQHKAGLDPTPVNPQQLPEHTPIWRVQFLEKFTAG